MEAVRVAIADGNEPWRTHLANELKSRGIDVIIAESTAEGLVDCVDRAPVDLALIELSLPPDWTNEGVLVAQYIASLHPRTALILYTSQVSVTDYHTFTQIRHQALGYIVKDCDVETLIQYIDRVVGGDMIASEVIRVRHEEWLATRSFLARLTDRETKIIGLLADGHTNELIARKLCLNVKTVEGIITSVIRKMPSSARDRKRYNQRVLLSSLWQQFSGGTD